MREIYLLNEGDSIKKFKTQLNLDELKEENDKINGQRYMVSKSGSDDITIVKNYLPMYVYRVKKDDNYLDMLSRGFKIECGENIQENDLIVLKKPRSIKHTVTPLENLNSIASIYGIDKNDIIVNNKLKSEKLFVGQILWI